VDPVTFEFSVAARSHVHPPAGRAPIAKRLQYILEAVEKFVKCGAKGAGSAAVEELGGGSKFE